MLDRQAVSKREREEEEGTNLCGMAPHHLITAFKTDLSDILCIYDLCYRSHRLQCRPQLPSTVSVSNKYNMTLYSAIQFSYKAIQ
jgi:hypothetical protein